MAGIDTSSWRREVSPGEFEYLPEGQTWDDAITPDPEPGNNVMPDQDADRISKDPRFNTAIDPTEEDKFQLWKRDNAPDDSGYDYDLKGAYRAGITRDPVSGHMPDTFKKPNHPTFSDQSQYAPLAPDKAGTWDGDTYVPASVLAERTGERSSQGRKNHSRIDPNIASTPHSFAGRMKSKVNDFRIA